METGKGDPNRLFGRYVSDTAPTGSRRGHAQRVEEFLAADDDAIIGQLTTDVAKIGFKYQYNTQVLSWRQELEILKAQLCLPEFSSWFIIFEYQIPRRSKRPDVVLIADNLIFVLEFKNGATSYDASAKWQVEEYCLNLRDFHAESHGYTIVPVLCASDAPSSSFDRYAVTGQPTPVGDVLLTMRENLGDRLMKVFHQLRTKDPAPLDCDKWLNSKYLPTPAITDAAVELYEGHSVQEITHRYAANLDRTTQMLSNLVRQSRHKKCHTICFVTGIPGAGKTLTGLEIVHDPALRTESALAGVFLSGNGPLVDVIQEAIVRSRKKDQHPQKLSKHEISTFIQNVHKFLSHYLEQKEQCPPEHVVVFDEAQRAWNRERMKRKRKVNASEPSLLLDVMERFPDWAVVIALVGGGQEIFLGEAGLEEWGRALATRAKQWSIVASPEVLQGGTSVAGHRLFEGDVPASVDFRAEPLAHLLVGVRSQRAQQFAVWVNDLLALDSQSCRQNLPAHREFPLVITRDLERARAWLRARSAADPGQRCGLVATSEDQRLRAYGLERSSGFRRGYQFEHWFLSPPNDPRSSFSLEVAASEFECQGLELDWVGLCWGGDLSPSDGGDTWEYRRFRGRWEKVRNESERNFTLNRYRVLLTRARQGMVIWVPPGDPLDPTRDPARFDRVYRFLRAAGLPEIEPDFLSELKTKAA